MQEGSNAGEFHDGALKLSAGMEPPDDAEVFVAERPGTEAVVMRIGIHSTQVILIGPSGEWLRLVVDSPDQARELCLRLEVEAHDGYPDHLRQRIGAYQRSPEDWVSRPYPEQARATPP